MVDATSIPPPAPAGTLSASASASVRRKLIVGNWKMNGSRFGNSALLNKLLKELHGTWSSDEDWPTDVGICAPSPYLAAIAEALQFTAIGWGGQDCSEHAGGAYTGDVSAAMLKEFGCRWVIVGHSERRAYHAESDRSVADKAKIAIEYGLTPIVCVGETTAERDAGRTADVVRRQLAAVIDAVAPYTPQIVVAYEPVWAIGTGRTATPAQAQDVHARLRAQLADATARAANMPILYGGSMKPDNAAELLAQPDIDGGLIGGASLNARDFAAICRATEPAGKPSLQ